MLLRQYIGAVGLVTIVVCGAAFAKPPEGKGKHKHEHESQSYTEPMDSVSHLTSAGISLAAAQQLVRQSGIAPGSYKPLPPGIQKNLARGKPLPPGIAKKSPPTAVLSGLPKHAGYEWQVVGTDLALVQIGTSIVSDVLKHVFQ